MNPSAAPYFKHMRIFNGIIGVSVIFAMWGNTYFFSWYGVYDNPQDLISMRQGIGATLIAAAFLVVPLLMFVMGFVSTFSLLHNKTEESGMTLTEGLAFIGRRILKLLPF